MTRPQHVGGRDDDLRVVVAHVAVVLVVPCLRALARLVRKLA